MDWMGTPRVPRADADRGTVRVSRSPDACPNSCSTPTGDQFFLPDSSQFYFDDLRGEKHLRYVPNTSHSLDKSDALETLHAFYAAIVSNTPRPEVRWSFERDGSIKVVVEAAAERACSVWQAVNPRARNFRLDVVGAAYKSTTLTPPGPNTWVAPRGRPNRGLDGVFRRDELPERREVSVEDHERRTDPAGQASVRGAEAEAAR